VVRGQATVEFALILFVLMSLVYGILEVSRLVFIGAEINNASREAAQFVAFHQGANAAYLRDSVVGPKLFLANRAIVVVEGPVYTRGGDICQFCPVQVTVSYEWTTLVSLLNLGPVTLRSTTTKLIESVGN